MTSTRANLLPLPTWGEKRGENLLQLQTTQWQIFPSSQQDNVFLCIRSQRSNIKDEWTRGLKISRISSARFCDKVDERQWYASQELISTTELTHGSLSPSKSPSNETNTLTYEHSTHIVSYFNRVPIPTHPQSSVKHSTLLTQTFMHLFSIIPQGHTNKDYYMPVPWKTFRLISIEHNGNTVIL